MNDTESENVYKKFQRKITTSTSTPNSIILASRQSIHPDKSVSPITRIRSNNVVSLSSAKEHFRKQHRSGSESHSDSDHSQNSSDECDEEDGTKSYSYGSSSRSGSYIHESSPCFSKRSDHNIPSKTPSRAFSTNDQTLFSNLGIIYSCLTFVVVSALLAIGASVISSENTVVTINPVTIEVLQDSFPRQSGNLWNALETGIEEVKSFNKPSVFLLLYEAKTEETINRILRNMSKYVVCVLKENCEIEPIILTRTILGSEKARTDYGYLIHKYKSELQERSVMIVSNLDDIPGEVAQAFHSMCDEYTPLVERAVFFFTMRIENINRSDKTDLQMIEEVLRKNWSILDDDIFYPLFTRISSIVLRVVPEKM